LPGQSSQEQKDYQRLQNVEKEFQGHQDALFEYNEMEKGLDYSGMSKSQIYQSRLELLRGIADRQGLSSVYEQAVSQNLDAIDQNDDTVVNLPDDPEATKDQGFGAERANFVDPDEQALFLRSKQQEAQEFKNWEHFSYVAPGFGLGGPQRNSLQRANMEAERRRFATVKMAPARKQMKNRPLPVEMPGREDRRPVMIPIYENDYGDIHYEDAYHNDYQDGRRIVWTDPYVDSGSRQQYHTGRSIYQPDLSGYDYAMEVNGPFGRRAVDIGEVAKPAEYRYTDKRFYQTNGPSAQLQNRANNFPDYGEGTMITKGMAGRADERVPVGIRDIGSALKAGIYSSRM
jgi:hypothetical protein